MAHCSFEYVKLKVLRVCETERTLDHDKVGAVASGF